MLVFFALFSREVEDHRTLVIARGIILQLFWLFYIGWLITAAVIFWGDVYPNGFCDNAFGNYMWAVLIIHIIVIPVGLYSSTIRGEAGPDQVITIIRKETEMSKQ